MGRHRKINSLGLPKNVYLKHGAFYFVDPSGKWKRIGTDVNEARRVGRLYADPEGRYGTLEYWIDMFVQNCATRVGLTKARRGIARRTYEDYANAAPPLKAFFGKMLPNEVEGHHIAAYLDLGAQADRAIRANRERAMLSACFSWMLRQPEIGVQHNPCKGIARNPESARERYVEHSEYSAVWNRANSSVQLMMDLLYRTLQRPQDFIRWSTRNLVFKREPDGDSRLVLRTIPQKTDSRTGITIDILVIHELKVILERSVPGCTSQTMSKHIHQAFLRKRDGHEYTYAGLSAMFRRCVDAAFAAGEISSPFTLYDLKGKGATDMWLGGKSLSEIQVLCGHKSVTTTERYVKSRWRGTVEPNRTEK